MKYFRSTKPKSISSNPHAHAPSYSDQQSNGNFNKSLISMSPPESVVLNTKTNKSSRPFAPINFSSFLMRTQTHHHAQSQDSHKSLDEPRQRAQSAFDYSMRKDESKSKNSLVGVVVNPEDKVSIQDHIQPTEPKALRYRPSEVKKDILGIGDEAGLGKVLVRSVTELGPDDVEITERDGDKTSKMATIRIDSNPFSDRKRQQDNFVDSGRLNTESAPLITEGPQGETRSPDELLLTENDRNRQQLTETSQFIGFLDSPKDQGENFAIRLTDMTVASPDSQRPLVDEKSRHKNSHSFGESSSQFKSAVKKTVIIKKVEIKDDGEVSCEFSAKEDIRRKSNKGGKGGLVKKKGEGEGKDKVKVVVSPTGTSTLTGGEEREGYKWDIVRIVVYLVIIYGIMPFGAFFGAFGYDNKVIKEILNFGILGLIQGIVQVMLLYQLIDVPILVRVIEIEGKNRGLINANKFLVINKTVCLVMLLLSTGFQIAVGIIITSVKLEITSAVILVISLFTTVFTGLIWLFIMFLRSPRLPKGDQAIFGLELKEIGKIRKDFMHDLYDTKKTIHIRALKGEALPKTPSNPLSSAYLGVSSGIVSTIEMDTRKLQYKIYDHSSEFKKIRFQSIKTFSIQILAILQVLIMIQVIKLIERLEDVAASIACVLVLLVIGSIFGLFDLFTSAAKPILNTMKLVSIIVSSGVYRFLFLGLTSRDKMIGAAVIRLFYKGVIYFFELLFAERIQKKLKINHKETIMVDFYDTIQDRETLSIRHPIYMFQKFSLLQETDLFFAVVSLYLNYGAETWLTEMTGLRFGLKVDYTFYLDLVFVEMAIHFVLGVLFVWVVKKIVKSRVKVVSVSLREEFMRMMKERRWGIICFKGLLLFILLFIFFNQV